MPETSAGRLAQTRVPIHPGIAARWSPRMFDPDAVITGEQITALLEAARWAGWRSQPGWGRPFDTETADRSTKPT